MDCCMTRCCTFCGEVEHDSSEAHIRRCCERRRLPHIGGPLMATRFDQEQGTRGPVDEGDRAERHVKEMVRARAGAVAGIREEIPRRTDEEERAVDRNKAARKGAWKGDSVVWEEGREAKPGGDSREHPQGPSVNRNQQLRVIAQEVCACRKCPRLVKYREKVAREKRRAYREWTYWGRPLPGFGDARAELFILGLAPAAHGGNRTGRVFTGDRSGDFLYKALFEVGFANQPTSARRGDGLTLQGAYVAAAVRCAPPANKPLPSEILHCREYLERELETLRPKVVLALGKIAWDAYLEILKQRGQITSRAAFRFGHGAECVFEDHLPRLFGVYHPRQQNTQTGRLTHALYA